MLWCWYHGQGFRGYQTQPGVITVQDTLVQALRAAGFSRTPQASGRTDAGVHARMQVLSLRVVEGVEPADVPARLAPHLPPGLGFSVAREAKAGFNPAWRHEAKEYRYRLALTDVPRWAAAAWRVDVDVAVLDGWLQRLVGTRDFLAFHSPSSAHKPRTLSRVTVVELEPGVVEVRLVGDAFGRYQVRRMLWAAVAVARGALPAETFLAALEQATPLAGHRAPAEALCLWEVFYPPEVDPFTAAERREAPGLPGTPPFAW